MLRGRAFPQVTVHGDHWNILETHKTLSLTSTAYTLWLMERPRMDKREAETTRKDILPSTATIMTTSTPSPTITAVELTAVEIIEAAITNHLNL